MNEQTQTVFPSNGTQPAVDHTREPIMLEGMKVLFDEKVGLYPVELVAKAPQKRRREAEHDGQLGRTRAVARL
jgi:hypothetical protein